MFSYLVRLRFSTGALHFDEHYFAVDDNNQVGRTCAPLPCQFSAESADGFNQLHKVTLDLAFWCHYFLYLYMMSPSAASGKPFAQIGRSHISAQSSSVV